jgi:hypothetical protein
MWRSWCGLRQVGWKISIYTTMSMIIMIYRLRPFCTDHCRYAILAWCVLGDHGMRCDNPYAVNLLSAQIDDPRQGYPGKECGRGARFLSMPTFPMDK